MPDAPRHQKTALKRVFASLAFCALLLAALWYVSPVLKPSGRNQWVTYGALPKDSIDVLFMGTSHTYTGIDPATIWRKRGISSFVLAGPGQKLQITDFWLREALKTQHPKVVVLEAVGLYYSESQYNPGHHLPNIHNMPLTLNRLGACVVRHAERPQDGCARRAVGVSRPVAGAEGSRLRREAEADRRRLHERLRPDDASNTGPVKSKPVSTGPMSPSASKALAYNTPALRAIAAPVRDQGDQACAAPGTDGAPRTLHGIAERRRGRPPKGLPGRGRARPQPSRRRARPLLRG